MQTPSETRPPPPTPTSRNKGLLSVKSGLLLATLLGFAAVGSLALHELGVERQQAQTLVDEARVDLKHGKRADAALALERANLLAPRAAFVRAALAEGGVSDALSPLPRNVAWLAPREWSFLMVTLGWAAGLGLVLSLVVNGASRAARRLLFGTGLLFASAGFGVLQSTFTSQALAVVNEATGVLVAPYAGAGATADLPAGVVVTVGARYGAFVQVQGPDGARGWVSERALHSVVAG
jgi:Bacterial SH3 domain